MPHYALKSLNEPFFKWLLKPNGNGLLNTVGQYSALSVNLAGNALKVYYDGMLILTVPEKIAVNECIEFSPLSIQYCYESDSRLKSIVEEGVTLMSLQAYLDSAIAFLSRRDNKRQEERLRQLIAYENNRSRFANDTDYFVVAQEYGFAGHKERKTSKFDLVSVKWPSKSTCRKRFLPQDVEIVVFELKLGLGAIGGSAASQGKKADLKSHIRDFKDCILSNAEVCESFKYDVIRMFTQQASLPGFLAPNIKGLKHVRNLQDEQAIKNFASRVNVRFGFIIADYKEESALLREQLSMIEDDFLFATSSFMGYGLYEKFMLNRKSILDKLK